MSGAHTSLKAIVGAYVLHQGSSAAKSCTPWIQLSPSGEYLTGSPVPVLKTHHVAPSWIIVGSCAPRAPVRAQLAADAGPAAAARSRKARTRLLRDPPGAAGSCARARDCGPIFCIPIQVAYPERRGP